MEENGQDFGIKFVFEDTENRLTEEFPQNSWTKRGVNEQLKKLRDTGTVDRRSGSGTPRSACTEENVETVND